MSSLLSFLKLERYLVGLLMISWTFEFIVIFWKVSWGRDGSRLSVPDGLNFWVRLVSRMLAWACEPLLWVIAWPKLIFLPLIAGILLLLTGDYIVARASVRPFSFLFAGSRSALIAARKFADSSKKGLCFVLFSFSEVKYVFLNGEGDLYLCSTLIDFSFGY